MIDADNFIIIEPTVPSGGKLLCVVLFLFCVSSNDKHQIIIKIYYICHIKCFK